MYLMIVIVLRVAVMPLSSVLQFRSQYA